MIKSLKKQLKDILIEGKLTTEEELNQALQVQKEEGGRLSQILIRLGYIDEKELAACLGKELNIPPINLEKFRIDPEIVKIVPEQVARHYQLIVLSRIGPTLTVAMVDPLNIFAMDDIKALTNYKIEPVIGTEKDINEAINQCYGSATGGLEDILKDIEEKEVEVIKVGGDEIDTGQILKAVDETPVVKAVNLILVEAVKEKASDILIEPWQERMRVRYRVDGILHEFTSPPKSMHQAMVSRIKIMSDLDIAERRLPQDGRFKVEVEGREVDFRISVLPSSFGEKVAIRVLDKSAIKLNVEELGFELKSLKDLKECARQPHGMILVCGPTGCGKTTTLYSVLKFVDQPGLNLVTVEDPIEYELKGINQVTIKSDIGLTFSSALRSILRQDPDVIMVGEMRDYETVDVAVKAALTGHLVLSSLHTTTAPGAIVRLINMGIEPFLISSSILLVAAQRLVRKICPKCKESYQASSQVLEQLKLKAEELTLYRGKGCPQCSQTGYSGRVGIIETLVLGPELREMVMSEASSGKIKAEARRLGMRTLRENGVEKVLAGVTTVEEVLRVTGEDEEHG
ncbi:Flp pilus assembly complex ATPase component TadA [bacterium]|nr:Flp pilus assembly complex ATPase component TadA [bacterium]MCK4325297.1 Flp pilus assembly complex ATPase component TadA [bacterium]MCK4437101.1 Flp pilus assembly complex ATPase component TadA [bacterium]